MFKLDSVLMLGMLAAMSPVQAAEHRELGAHEHGHGTLNIAIEGNAVNMELEIPGADIVGFEHDAETAEQKATLDKAKATLARPLELFVFPATAVCSVSEAKVDVRVEHAEHDATLKQSGKTENNTAEAHHNELQATYVLSCKAPAHLTSIGFDFFNQFKGAQELDVNVVTGKGQSKFEVTRDNPVISLKGL